MDFSEISVFIIYLCCMLAIGVYFFFKDRHGGEKTYFLGNRQMGPWVAALSAGAMGAAIWGLKSLLPAGRITTILLVVAGVLVYAAAAVLLKAVSKEDLSALLRRKKKA